MGFSRGAPGRAPGGLLDVDVTYINVGLAKVESLISLGQGVVTWWEAEEPVV
jgi:hypothetical protein